MKIKLILLMITIGQFVYGQNTQAKFNLLEINDVDSALVILTKSANQQYKKIPVSINVTKEYISQNREVKKVDWLWTLTARTTTITKMTYFENITNVYVHYGWEIEFYSSITGKADSLVLKDRQMTEQALAALLCLIKNSGNKNYEKIIAEITASLKI